MRVVVNEAQIERNRKLSQILFFISLIGMGIGFFYTWTNPESSSEVSCLILPALLIMTLTSVRLANNWIREPRPVDVLNDALKGLGQKYQLFHYLLPAQHVLISPEGIFTLTTVWQDREYAVEGSKWKGDEGLVRKLNGYMRQDLLGNPFQEAQLDAQRVQKLMDAIAPDSGVEVQPLVVFINPEAKVTIQDPALPVLYADPKKSPSLRDYLRDQKDAGRVTLTDEQLDRLDQKYGLITRQEMEAIEAGQITYDPATNTYYAVEDAASAAVTGTSADLADDDALDEDGAEPTGAVYIIQGGQLYHIAATTGTLDDMLAQLRAESDQDLEVLHTIESDEPYAAEAYLHRKFARKKQKGHWYGLSRKDIAWLKSRKGELN